VSVECNTDNDCYSLGDGEQISIYSLEVGKAQHDDDDMTKQDNGIGEEGKGREGRDRMGG